MNSQTLDTLIAWVGQHPLAAGLVIFLVAFCDAVVILGIFVPAIPILFAIGTLIGLGSIDGPYAIACAGIGAFCGDGLSYVIGRTYGEQLRRMWPFSRHPEWLTQGEATFQRHGLKSILIARYVGAVRPFVPAIAGMLQMPVRRYAPASLAASLSWGAVFLIPGWVFGASVDLFAAVAGRLAIVVGALVATLALIGFVVYQFYKVTAPRASHILSRLLHWSVRHPVLGRFTHALVDPRRRESPSLLIMALLLIFAGWAFFSLILVAAGNGDPTQLDLRLHHLMFGLRTPLADTLMAVLASLGDWQVLLSSALVVLAWLGWRKRYTAAWHWIVAFVFGPISMWVLDRLVQVPRPPAAMAVAGFDFPAAPVAMATIVYGFFAVLVARELPGRRRAWPYAVAALMVTCIAFGRLYLGAHWFTDVLGGVLLGMIWISILGLAYRRRVTRSFWMRPLVILFYLCVVGIGFWHGTRHAQETLAQFAPPQLRTPTSISDWETRGWAQLPARRNDFLTRRAWPMNVQFAGDLAQLKEHLVAQGWEPAPQAKLETLLSTFDKEATPQTLPVLPASHNGYGDALLLSRPGPEDDTRIVLHLWFAPFALTPDELPLWQGSVNLLQFEPRLSLFQTWRLLPDDARALGLLEHDTSPFLQKLMTRPYDNDKVLLLRAQ